MGKIRITKTTIMKAEEMRINNWVLNRKPFSKEYEPQKIEVYHLMDIEEIPAVTKIDVATGDTVCIGHYDCDRFVSGCRY